MRLQNGARDGQPQARAIRVLMGARGMLTVKTIEEAGQRLRVNLVSGVLNLQDGGMRRVKDFNAHFAVIMGVPDGIGE